MTSHITINTQRLRLRSLNAADSSNIENAAKNKAIADTMISIPHPYPKGEALNFIKHRIDEFNLNKSFTYVIETKENNNFCGITEVRDIDQEHYQGEVSFWLSEESWGKGYMSEVVKSVTEYCFTQTNLNRLYAYHMLRNPASGKVLKKNGFTHEGTLRQRVYKLNKFEDVALWGILKSDYKNAVVNL